MIEIIEIIKGREEIIGEMIETIEIDIIKMIIEIKSMTKEEIEKTGDDQDKKQNKENNNKNYCLLKFLCLSKYLCHLFLAKEEEDNVQGLL